MLNVLLLPVALLNTIAPTVTPKRPQCTTEPAPKPPIVKAKASRGSILVDVIGNGAWCHATWATSIRDSTVELVPTPSKAASLCGTCALRLQVDLLERGRWTVVVDGVARNVLLR